MVAMSWTRSLVSRAFVVAERSWESLARRQGCVEMWMLGGSDMFAVQSWIWCGGRGRCLRELVRECEVERLDRLTVVRRVVEWWRKYIPGR